jgi:hypothetical protein
MSNAPGSPGEYQPGQWSGGQQPPPYPGGYGQQQPPVWGGYPQPGQPGQPGGYGPPPGAVGGPQGQAKGAFSALLDFEFNTFATPAVVKILYIVGIALIGLYYIGAVVVGFAQNVGIGLATLIVGGVVALFLLILFRVMLECYYAVARMSEDIRRKS